MSRDIRVRKGRWFWQACDFDWIGGEMESKPVYRSRNRERAIQKATWGGRKPPKHNPWERALSHREGAKG